MEIDPTTLNQLFLALIAFISAFTAWLASRNSTKINDVVATQAAQGATIRSMDTAQSIQMVTGKTANPVRATYRKMSDAVKADTCNDISLADQQSFLTQVQFNEEAGNERYVVSLSKGFLVVENGCIVDDSMPATKEG